METSNADLSEDYTLPIETSSIIPPLIRETTISSHPALPANLTQNLNEKSDKATGHKQMNAAGDATPEAPFSQTTEQGLDLSALGEHSGAKSQDSADQLLKEELEDIDYTLNK